MMNAKQRRKFAKAIMADLKNSTDDEKLKAIVDSAADFAKQERQLSQYEDRIEELEAKLALAVEALKGACKHIEAPFGARTKCCFREALTKIKGETK